MWQALSVAGARRSGDEGAVAVFVPEAQRRKYRISPGNGVDGQRGRESLSTKVANLAATTDSPTSHKFVSRSLQSERRIREGMVQGWVAPPRIPLFPRFLLAAHVRETTGFCRNRFRRLAFGNARFRTYWHTPRAGKRHIPGWPVVMYGRRNRLPARTTNVRATHPRHYRSRLRWV